MKYFIKVSGSWCYDASGLTFPLHVALPIEAAIKRVFPEAEIRWERYLGWSNQPHVCVADLPDDVLRNDLKAVLGTFDTDLEAAGLYNRFYWSEYWGYDFDGDGAWGSVYDYDEDLEENDDND